MEDRRACRCGTRRCVHRHLPRGDGNARTTIPRGDQHPIDRSAALLERSSGPGIAVRLEQLRPEQGSAGRAPTGRWPGRADRSLEDAGAPETTAVETVNSGRLCRIASRRSCPQPAHAQGAARPGPRDSATAPAPSLASRLEWTQSHHAVAARLESAWCHASAWPGT